MVKRLCMLDISHRLGMMAGGIEEILEHPFFAEARPPPLLPPAPPVWPPALARTPLPARSAVALVVTPPTTITGLTVTIRYSTCLIRCPI